MKTMGKRDRLTRYTILLASVMLLFLACGCVIASRSNVDATVAAALAETQTAQPINTSTSLPTATPTHTPTATSTHTPTATSTQAPTFTPTVAPLPTLTPTSSPTPTPAASTSVVTSTLASGWILYELQDDNFGIAMPPEWLPLSLDPSFIDEMLKTVGDQNPAVSQYFTSDMLRGLIASGIKFYGFDLSAKSIVSGFPPSVNVIRIELPFELSLDDYASLNLKQIETMAKPDTPITHQRVKLGNIDAEEFGYEIAAGDATSDLTAKVTQYLALDAQTAYVVTMACLSESATDYAAIFEDMGASFRLLNGSQNIQ